MFRLFYGLPEEAHFPDLFNLDFFTNLYPDYALENVSQQYFSIISSAHRLFWIAGIAGNIEIQNGSKCLRLMNPLASG